MQSSIFKDKINNQIKKNAPLADRMRPTTLEEFVGQEHILGENKLLNRMIKADKISSIILYGPAGCGKTTLAKIIANQTSSYFYSLNAVTCGVKDIRDVISRAKDNLIDEKRSILFIDEIHRFNKSQQDALLPSVESGVITLIGATTENPFFEINSPLISRSTLFNLKAISSNDIKNIIKNTLKDKEKGLGGEKINITDEALSYMSNCSNGDARSVLNALELAYLTTPKNKDGMIDITLEVASECMQKRKLNYDKKDNEHYDTITGNCL